MDLERTVWDNVDRVLHDQGRDHSFIRERLRRNKNTYTQWFKYKKLKKISDLQALDELLEVSPSALLAVTPEQSPQSLLVEFAPGTRVAAFNVETHTQGLLIRTAS